MIWGVLFCSLQHSFLSLYSERDQRTECNTVLLSILSLDIFFTLLPIAALCSSTCTGSSSITVTNYLAFLFSQGIALLLSLIFKISLKKKKTLLLPLQIIFTKKSTMHNIHKEEAKIFFNARYKNNISWHKIMMMRLQMIMTMLMVMTNIMVVIIIMNALRWSHDPQ